MKKIINATFGCLLACSLLIPVVYANEDQELIDEVSELKAQVLELQTQQAKLITQVEGLTKRLDSATRSRAREIDLKDVTISAEGDPRLGDAGAEIVLVEFSDYQCPYCQRHTVNTAPQLVKEYVDAGKLQIVFKDFPLERIHKEAVAAAVAANCAGAQDRYWDMHHVLFENPKNIEPVSAHAEKLGLDLAAFEQCVADDEQVKEVRSDLAEARKIGVSSTPTFILGKPNEDGSITGLRLIRGAVAFKKFKEEIDALQKTLAADP